MVILGVMASGLSLPPKGEAGNPINMVIHSALLIISASAALPANPVAH
jgi:hypothetical protein